MANNNQQKVELFIDSGAFSAFTQGVSIDLDEYIAFIKQYQDIITVYANLDVIGDAEGTLVNQKRMEKAGLSPLPCFHYGEPIEFLKYYLGKYKYIALGGMVPISTKDLGTWLDNLFANYICDKDGMPRVQVHGFGLTSLKLMLRYPWYSVDSTSWVVTGRMGAIYVPKPWAKSLDEVWKVSLSNRSPNQSEAGKHLSSFSPNQRQYVLDYIKQKGYKLGKSEFRVEAADYELKEKERWNGKAKGDRREVEMIIESGVCNDYRKRDELNIIYFLDLEKAMPKWPWAFKLSWEGREGFGI
jgi:hypothetical protein